MESTACNKNIALIIMHIDSPKFSTLVTKLANYNFKIIVHVDKKSSIDLDFLKDKYPQATFLSDYEVFWGGANMLRVMIALLELGLECEKSKNFFFVSGEDSVNDRATIPDPRHVIRRVRREVPVTWFRRKVSKRCFFGKWNLDKIETNQQISRNFFGRAFVKVRNFALAFANQNIDPPFALLLKSSQWVCLDREDAELCVEAFKDDKIERFFAFFPVPDEWFFYTIINHFIPEKYNYVIGGDELPQLTYECHAINWTTRDQHPEKISSQTFHQSKCYFGRKISDSESQRTWMPSLIFLSPRTYHKNRYQISKIAPHTVFSYDSEIMHRVGRLFRYCRGFKTELNHQQQTNNLMNLCVSFNLDITIISENKRLQLAAQQTLSQKNLNLKVKQYRVLTDLRVAETHRANTQELTIMLVSGDNYIKAYSDHIGLIDAPLFVTTEDLFKSSIDRLVNPESVIQPALRKSWFPYRNISLSGILGIIFFIIDGGKACVQSRSQTR